MVKFFKLYLHIILKDADKKGISQDEINHYIRIIREKHGVSGLEQPDSIDYNKPAYRYAYLYMYVTCHIRMVKMSLNEFRVSEESEFNEWMESVRSGLKICSIGGGPGSDIIAALCFLKQIKIHSETEIDCFVVDKYEGWQDLFFRSYQKLQQLEAVSDRVMLYFMQSDLLNEFSGSLKNTVRSSDLITLSMFVSSIAAHPDCETTLMQIVDNMKPGALLYFADNSGGPARSIMSEAAFCGELTNVHSWQFDEFRIDPNREEGEMLDDAVTEQFQAFSKRNVNIVVEIWKKGSGNQSHDFVTPARSEESYGEESE